MYKQINTHTHTCKCITTVATRIVYFKKNIWVSQCEFKKKDKNSLLSLLIKKSTVVELNVASKNEEVERMKRSKKNLINHTMCSR